MFLGGSSDTKPSLSRGSGPACRSSSSPRRSTGSRDCVHVPPEQGLRQGDLLSCILLILTIEPFIQTLIYNAELRGLQIRLSTTKVVLYADDTTIVVCSMRKIQVVVDVLEGYSMVFGTKVNWNKSKLMLIGGLTTLQADELPVLIDVWQKGDAYTLLQIGYYGCKQQCQHPIEAEARQRPPERYLPSLHQLLLGGVVGAAAGPWEQEVLGVCFWYYLGVFERGGSLWNRSVGAWTSAAWKRIAKGCYSPIEQVEGASGGPGSQRPKIPGAPFESYVFKTAVGAFCGGRPATVDGGA
ncbi:hypothetical protein B7494_g3786 [Chlorociboria aeruginascens]|nr:hypothetical protein B7494_g3786 [Chlorociboria aeruginascens]